MPELMQNAELLFDVPGGWTQATLELCGRRFTLTVPADPDRVLEAHVADSRATNSDASAEVPDPYWATLWSAASATALAVLRSSWPRHETVLELGCGVGLVGLAALSQGLEVTFSDYLPAALTVALHNARQNGYPHARGMLLDWLQPPEQQYAVILASDILYNRAHHVPILAAIDRLLAPGGVCWIGDPGRMSLREFLQTASRDFHLQLQDRDGAPLGMPHVGHFQLCIMRRRGADN